MSDTTVPIENLKELGALFDSAKKGDPSAQHKLGAMLDDGHKKIAQELYKESAAQGYTVAQHDLAVMLIVGKYSENDKEIAINLLKTAAAKGYEPSITWLKDLEELKNPDDQMKKFLAFAQQMDNGSVDIKDNKHVKILLDSMDSPKPKKNKGNKKK
jgi:TPR repeat protein